MDATLERTLAGPPGAEVSCPACGGANPADAVFCGSSSCGKALGEFRYVAEEVDRKTAWHQRLADRVMAWITGPHFFGGHLAWLGLWILLNAGILVFDEYPYVLLVTIIAIETLFITLFVLISAARENAVNSERDQLDYEVNVRTYRKILELDEEIRRLRRSIPGPERPNA